MENLLTIGRDRMDLSVMRTFYLGLLLAPLWACWGFTPIVGAQQHDKFYRLSIDASKKDLQVKRRGQTVIIKTKDLELYKSIKKELSQGNFDQRFIHSLEFDQTLPEGFQVKFRSSSSDIFAFYKELQKAHVVDFWHEGPEIPRKEPKVSREMSKRELFVPRPKLTKAPRGAQKKAPGVSTYFDFQHGAPFIWNYEAILPPFQKGIDLSVKTPEAYFPIEDRNIKKGPAQAHLQLAINLYRKEKYGLMYKSIKLFREKYGNDHQDNGLLDYLKANAMLKDSLKNPSQEGTHRVAVSMFEKLALKTEDKRLKRGIFKYLILYYYQKSDIVRTLDFSKKLYMENKARFDYKEAALATEMILYCIARLNQIEDIEKLSNDKTLSKFISKQTFLAYQSFTLLTLGKTKELVALYARESAHLARPIHRGILFNVGEAYFREGNYKRAVDLFSYFLEHYSFHNRADEARLRVALSYDLLGHPPEKVEKLYRNAIDRSSRPDVRYEASLRYIGMRSIRKKSLGAEDLEIRELLSLKRYGPKKVSRDLKEMLWLVRLRSFIRDYKLQEALEYLEAIPIEGMGPLKKRVFKKDGFEIVSEIIKGRFQKGEHEGAVKFWEFYSKSYIGPQSFDANLYYMIGSSYIRLGFFQSLDTMMEKFAQMKSEVSKTKKIFRWFDSKEKMNYEDIVRRLQIHRNMKLKNWKLAYEINEKWPKKSPLYFLYKGVIVYHLERYSDSIKALEEFILVKNNFSLDRDLHDSFYEAYTDSLYRTKNTKKYQRVVEVILNDKKLKGKVYEKALYIYLENLSSMNTIDSFLKLEVVSREYLDRFKNSVYFDKVRYLLGISYVKNLKVGAAKEIFDNIVHDGSSSKSVKELAQTELTLLKLKEKKI